MQMTPTQLVLRCYAEHTQGKWQAYCLDLCLAAQADSFDSAKSKLEGMIAAYVYDAVVGEDREHADQLLNRRAPLQSYAKYYATLALQRFGVPRDGARRAFREAMPLAPMPLDRVPTHQPA